MAKVGVSEAARLAQTSRTDLYRKMKSGNLSFSTDEKGDRRIDTEELFRVYGKLVTQDTQHVASEPATMTHIGTADVAQNDGDLVALLKAQLEEARARELWYQNELAKAQEQVRILALPAGSSRPWWQFWK